MIAVDGRRAHGHAADLRSLAEHRDEPTVEIAVGSPQPAALADAQPGSVQHLEQREVATRKGGGDRVVAGAGELVGPCRRGVEERHRLGRCRDPGQAGLALGGAQRATRVCRKHARAVEVPEIRREPPRPCGRSSGARSRACSGYARYRRRARRSASRGSRQPPRSAHATNSRTSCSYALRVWGL